MGGDAMNAAIFNVEEMNLIAMFLPADSRFALIKRLYREIDQQGDDIRELIKECIRKLSRISDQEYATIYFSAAI